MAEAIFDFRFLICDLRLTPLPLRERVAEGRVRYLGQSDTPIQNNMSYDQKYDQASFYWGKKPSSICLKVLELLPVDPRISVLDVGCGEGRNAVFLARNGFNVTAFDISSAGIAKTLQLAQEANVQLRAFEADMLKYCLTEPVDVIFCHGCLGYIPPEMRQELLAHYKEFTRPGGLNVFSAFVQKPFIERAPDAEPNAYPWISGELFTHYHDWKFELCSETIFDCTSSGVPHKHAVNQLIARKA